MVNYFVTTFTMNADGIGWHSRCWGYLEQQDWAIDAVENNENDIWEGGTCQYAVIEAAEPAMMPDCKQIMWFMATNLGSTMSVDRIQRPVIFDGIVNFSLG